MFFRDYFFSCRFLIPSRKNMRSRFFLFFFTRVFFLRASTRLTGNGERLGIFRRSDRTYTRERTRNRITFFRYIATRKTHRRHRRRHHAQSSSVPPTRRRFRAHVIVKCPRGDLSRSNVTIYESLRAEGKVELSRCPLMDAIVVRRCWKTGSTASSDRRECATRSFKSNFDLTIVSFYIPPYLIDINYTYIDLNLNENIHCLLIKSL